ncbi:hypothetical protein L596_020652 [Steinernema carpocapsae]|uniref:G-protein coupled receptors family 1 profile domain-containing protein n=1 Tax=Steinernema carpocapsae TaxID=34508 RepID=A0A4U5MUY4_STECR|nr:hypothetical protein L596_020652 [Steinernema carpocapsae]
MLALGCADLVCLLLNCFLNGFFLLQGYVFCSSPYFLYSTGCLLDAVWAAEASLSILLAVNRCADFWKFKFFKALFEGFAVNIWLGVVALYSFYFFMFPSPPLFSSIHSGLWFSDPYDDIDYEGRDHELYSNWALLANNVTLVIALPVLYSALVLSIKFSQTTSAKKKHHMQVAIQALMICLLNFFSAALYVYMHIWSTHVFLNIVCLLGWQGSSGRS